MLRGPRDFQTRGLNPQAALMTFDPSSNHPVYGPSCILADINRGSLQAADAYGALLGLLRSSRLVRLRPKKMTRCRLRRLVA